MLSDTLLRTEVYSVLPEEAGQIVLKGVISTEALSARGTVTNRGHKLQKGEEELWLWDGRPGEAQA